VALRSWRRLLAVANVAALAVVTTALSVTLAASGAPHAQSFAGISAGSNHTCAVTRGGGAKCWGSNTIMGTVGNGSSTAFFRTAVDVKGLKSGVAAIAAGGNHSCAVTGKGGVKCWGNNSGGALGTGTTISYVRRPADVTGLKSAVKAIVVGNGFNLKTCALTRAGGVKCWGEIDFGGLGNGSTARSPKPVDVVGLRSGVGAISIGGVQICAITSAGGAKCWGTNTGGALGTGSTTSQGTPADVSGLTSGVKAIAAGGGHTCALTSGGGVKCWGSNTRGQLGNGSTTGTFLTGVDVAGLTSGVKAIAAGTNHTCALTSSGGVKCWGWNQDGQLGNGSTADSRTPVDVAGLTGGVRAITAGGNHTCAITSSGKAKCWGSNRFGQLGSGSTKSSTQPVDVR
jgi:alpha-tubulin suppressor-like RCC1 family protein